MNTSFSNRLLGTLDASPVIWKNQHASSSIALVCEHAGNAVPSSLNNLGLVANQLSEHTAIDIGAKATACRVSDLLDAPLLMQHYSRLVIDCNRPTAAHDAIPETSHGTSIPANSKLNEEQRLARIDEIFMPYDNALGAFLETSSVRFAFSIHSFTPTLGQTKRPWDIGFLYRHDSQTSRILCQFLTDQFPALTIGLNQPYQIDDKSDWFVPRHAERLGLNHSLIEIRNDHLQTTKGQDRMATILAAAIRHVSGH